MVQAVGPLRAVRTDAALLRSLEASSVAYIATSLVATAVAIRANRPAEFGGSHTDRTALRSFLVGNGTAMAPPLVWLVAQGAMTALLRLPGRWRTGGVTGLGIVGLLTAIGALGEPMTRENLDPARTTPTRFLVEVGMVVLPVAMMGQAIAALVRQSPRAGTGSMTPGTGRSR